MKVFCLKTKELFSIRVYHSLPAYDQWNRLEGTLCIYCRKGNFEMNIDGQGYRLKPGSIAICQPGSLVRFTDDSRNLEFVLILLSDELLADIRIPYPAYFMLFFKEHPFMVLQEGQLAGIEATLRAIERIYKDDKNRFRIPIATLHVQNFFWKPVTGLSCPDSINRQTMRKACVLVSSGWYRIIIGNSAHWHFMRTGYWSVKDISPGLYGLPPEQPQKELSTVIFWER